MPKPGPIPHPRSTSRVGLAAVGLLLAISTGAMLRSPTWFVPDDGYFYLVLADHMRHGLGSTFDGTTFTNGYHPLWLWALVPIVRDGPDATLTAVVLTVSVLTAAALGLLARLAQAAEIDPAPAMAAALVYLIGTPNVGSELHLAVVLEIAAILALVRGPHSAATAGLAGALCGLTMLARLDLCFVVVAATLSLRHHPRRAIAFASAALVILAPYLLWNLLRTEHLVPISGATKSTFPVPQLDHLLTKVGGFGLGANVLCALLIPFGARLPQGALRQAWLPLMVGGLLQGLYTGCFTAFGWSQDYFYYYSASVLSVAIGLSVGATAFVQRLPSFTPQARSRLLAATSAVGAAICLIPTWTMTQPETAMVQASRWIDAHAPQDAVLFTTDAPGRLSFFGRRPVIALDGLTQDWSFDKDIRQPNLAAWLDRRGVTHIWTIAGSYDAPWVHCTSNARQTCLDAISPRTSQAAGEICLPNDDALIGLGQFTGARGLALPSTTLGGAALWDWRHDR